MPDRVRAMDPLMGAEELLRALYSAYVQAHPGTSEPEFRRKLQQGLALVADLQLEVPQRVVEQLEGPSLPPPAGPFQTDLVQHLLDQLSALSMEDGLTGLFNRRYFDHRLQQELGRARRDQKPCSVLLVDTDHFKKLNDTYGHSAGDQVLRRIAELMREALRTTDDVTTRFGGEEFAIILPGASSGGALIAAERLRASIEEERFEQEGRPFRVTVSAGLSTFDPASRVTAQELVDQADKALYEAKHAGRNRVHVHPSGDTEASVGVTAEEKEALRS